MAEKSNMEFDPTKSELAIELYKNRDNNQNRYLTKGKNDEDLFLSEASDYMNEKTEQKLPMAFAIYGGPLNTLISYVYKKVGPFIPEGFKLNPGVIIEDIEKFLREDKTKTQKSVTSVTPFISGIAYYIVDTANNNLEDRYGNKMSQYDNEKKNEF